MILTPNLVKSWQPCRHYTRERLVQLLGDGKPAELLFDLRRFRGVSVADRLWVLLRPEILDNRALRLFAIGAARRALHLVAEADQVKLILTQWGLLEQRRELCRA